MKDSVKYVNHKRDYAIKNRHIPRQRPDPLGLCLRCGYELTYCGEPFSLEIRCDKCGTVNIYKDSQQPIGVED